MSWETLFQPLIVGLLTGMTYVLVALGLTVIFSIMNVLNFAQGEIDMFGAFCVYFLRSLLHINHVPALLCCVGNRHCPTGGGSGCDPPSGRSSSPHWCGPKECLRGEVLVPRVATERPAGGVPKEGE